MTVRRYELYASISFRECLDPRWWVVLDGPRPDPSDPRETIAVVAPVSSAMDLLNRDEDFLLESSEPDFQATGLARTSYVIADWPIWVKVGLLTRRKGELPRGILSRFRIWSSQHPPPPPP